MDQKEWKVEIDPAFLAQVETLPPSVQDAARELVANLRQAAEAVNQGRYPSIQDAMEAISGKRMERIDE